VKTWDTNFLLRHLLQDDAGQLAVVRKQLKAGERRGESIFLPQIVLVETAWVLRSLLSKADVLATLQEVLDDERFLCESAADVGAALKAAASQGDLSDHLIGAAAVRAKATPVQTFDQAMAGSKPFEVYGLQA
jgi:predicted nucleic-acid-binding protein